MLRHFTWILSAENSFHFFQLFACEWIWKKCFQMILNSFSVRFLVALIGQKVSLKFNSVNIFWWHLIDAMAHCVSVQSAQEITFGKIDHRYWKSMNSISLDDSSQRFTEIPKKFEFHKSNLFVSAKRKKWKRYIEKCGKDADEKWAKLWSVRVCVCVCLRYVCLWHIDSIGRGI